MDSSGSGVESDEFPHFLVAAPREELSYRSFWKDSRLLVHKFVLWDFLRCKKQMLEKAVCIMFLITSYYSLSDSSTLH